MNVNPINKDEQWKLLVLLLDEIRKQNGISQEVIAERTGSVQSHVSRFFKAKYVPSLEIFLNYAKAVEVNFFFESKNSKTDLNKAFEDAMERLGRRADKLPEN